MMRRRRSARDTHATHAKYNNNINALQRLSRYGIRLTATALRLQLAPTLPPCSPRPRTPPPGGAHKWEKGCHKNWELAGSTKTPPRGGAHKRKSGSHKNSGGHSPPSRTCARSGPIMCSAQNHARFVRYDFAPDPKPEDSYALAIVTRGRVWCRGSADTLS